MKAVIMSRPGDPAVLSIGTVETPAAGPGELLVRVHAAALNRADTLQRRGLYPSPPGASEVLGMDIAGTVAGLGEGAEGFRVGDKVFGLIAGGGYAELATIPASLAMPVPPSLSFEQAAAIPEAFLTAFQVLVLLGRLRLPRDGAAEAGAGASPQRVLVHAGASGVGSAAIQIAHAAGGGSSREPGGIVYATAGSREKLDVCRSLGARLAVNYHDGPFDAPILADTEGRGVDIVVDFVGASFFDQNLSVLAEGGRMVIVATLGGNEVPNVDLGLLMRKHIEIIGTTLRSRSVGYRASLVASFRAAILPLLADRRIAPVIDRVFDWKDVADAHRWMEANRNIGKIVLTGM